jgi:hypothetical protein
VAVLAKAPHDPAVADAISARTEFKSLEDLAIHRSEELTVLAGALPPGFGAAPHNHNIWSVVAVCGAIENRTPSCPFRQRGELQINAELLRPARESRARRRPRRNPFEPMWLREAVHDRG